MSLVDASKVADLSARVQAERIGAGEDAHKVLLDILPAKNGRHCNVNDALASFVKGLRRALADLEGRVACVPPQQVDMNRADLKRARMVLRQLLARGSEEE